MNGKFTDIMKAAKDERQQVSKQESKKAIKDDRQKTSRDENIVNVCIKVPLSVRKRWTIEATTRETSLKDLIMEAVEKYLEE